MRIDLHPVFILHTRAYRETSLILEVFSHEHGRVGVVAKGARGRKSRYQGLLQAFLPLQMAWTGRSDLVTLTGLEAEGGLLQLPPEQLASGFYLNEILMRLLHRHEPMPELFMDYSCSLRALHENRPTEPVLRLFERRLLEHMGYGLLLSEDIEGSAVIAEKQYEYIAEKGPSLIRNAEHPDGPVISGETLLALAQGALHTLQQLRESKRLMRYILSPHLGNKPLHSRELFTAWRGK